ncbi:MAG TPA: hypothetical protein VJ779_13950, partial [Acetobacteraceae bacterium]|nr:hypothetical protein [Acetobacteraceae bacterium]
SPQHRDSALHPVIARIKRAAGFGRDDTAATRFAKLRALLAKSEASDEAVALVAALLSIPAGEQYRLPKMSPQKLRESTLAALLGLFAGLASQAPALVIFEDVHWIDPTTLELLSRVVERAASMRALVLVTARPEFRPPWPDQAHVTTMVLNRLGGDEAAMLADGVAGAVSLPTAVRRRIVRHAEGVPLFVEELTKAALESGLSAQDERPEPPVPASLHDLLLARLDRLGPAREVAQVGAVIGREFSHELLSAVAGQPDPALDQALARIVRSELLFRAGTPPEARYAFKHALVQQAAYESLPRSRRQELHARIAQALLPRDPGLEDPQLDLKAWHCEQGGLIEWAAVLYARAGFGSTHRGAFAEAHELFANASRMVAAMPEGEARDRMELDIVLSFIAVTNVQRGYANSEAAEAHRRAAELWERLERPAEYLEVPRFRYFFHFNRGELQHAQELALHIWDISQEQADPRYRTMGHLLIGYSMMLRGDLMGAESHLRDALALIRSDDPAVPWRSLSDWVAWSMAHLTLSRIKCLLGHLDQAGAHLSTVIDRAPPMRNAITPVEFSSIQVRVSSYFTEAAELAPSVERLSKLTREFGMALFDAMATINRGHVISCLGKPEQGISLMEEGIAAYAATEAAIWSGYHRALLSEAYQRLGRLHEARQLLIEAQHGAERSGERWYDAELARRLGEVDRQGGDLGAAESRFKQALAIARRQHAKLWELHAATSLARLWQEQQRSAEARAVLAPVYGWFTEGLDTGSLRRAKAVLEELEASLPLRPEGRRRR